MCAEVCPTGVTITGDRDKLLAEARTRVAGDPKSYYQWIYGATEAGRHDVFFIGPKDPAALGLPRANSMARFRISPGTRSARARRGAFRRRLPRRMFWLTKRKDEVARAEHSEKGEHHGEERLGIVRMGFWTVFSGPLIPLLAAIAYVRDTRGSAPSRTSPTPSPGGCGSGSTCSAASGWRPAGSR